MSERIVKISVRDMVEFVLRSGSIEARYMGMKRAVEGTRIHQQIQRMRKKQALLNAETYEKEVSLTHTFSYKDFIFQVEGRADGIWSKKAAGDAGVNITIEEIKSTLKPLEFIENEPDHWHWAQAKCYGFLYGAQNGIYDMDIQLTYSHVESGESKIFVNHFTFSEVETFFYSIVERYYRFAKLDYDRVSQRNETGKGLGFPYEQYRGRQRAFAVAVYKTILQGRKLYAQAPTGTGKTISTLFPAVKALAEGLAEKVFYVTAKTTTRQAAEEAFALMEVKGLVSRSITITAKEKICFCGGAACSPAECSYADGHFDRINAAIFDIVQNETAITRQEMEAYARKHHVCPFEFSLDITLFCDCIICDYNYVYDPKVHMKRFFGEEARGSFVVLHDEAHNLVDRARDMFSAQLEKSRFIAFRKECRGKNPSVSKAIGKIVRWFDSISDREGVTVTHSPPVQALELLRQFVEKTDMWLAEESSPVIDNLLDLYFQARDFIRIWDFFDERYVFYVESRSKETVVKLFCLDPAYLLSLTQKKMKAAVFFSATLTPMGYFRQALGGEKEDYTLRLPSPFTPENLCLLIDNNVSTIYQDRQASYGPIARRLYQMVNGKSGRYLAFFPSYEYMRRVQEVFMNNYPEFPVITQTPNMAEEEREQFLAHFSDSKNQSENQQLIGFTVLGGIFSEGIDLAGNRLVGAAIVGVGLPLITPERNVIMDYYKAHNMNGFDYAYVYPGMIKVLQAAGRVIRSPQDRGVLLLLDSRVLNAPYKNLLPEEWKHFVRLSAGEKMITEALGKFWRDSFT